MNLVRIGTSSCRSGYSELWMGLVRQAQQELRVRRVAALVGVPEAVVREAPRGTLPGWSGATAPAQARSHRRASRHGSRR
jgi:hypothetical protein